MRERKQFCPIFVNASFTLSVRPMLAPTISFPEKPKHPSDTNKWKREEQLMETAGKVKRLSGENWGWHPLHWLFLIQQGFRVIRRMNHKTQIKVSWSNYNYMDLQGPCKNHATKRNLQFSASWKITRSFSALSLERACQWGHLSHNERKKQ